MFDGTVTTSAGVVRGVEADGCWAFLGLRFAAPITGPLRFAAPQPVEPWSGVRLADSFAPLAPQPASGLGSYVPGDPMEQGDDCLALNCWTPTGEGSRRPVIVFLHGGGFLSGTGSSVMYRGAALARRGVVVVTLNYRLGFLGFLAHPALDKAGATFANRGLLDQLAGLEWTHEHIASFGGDPDNITLVGESAGAMSIADLIALPRTRVLVRRAVMESGATLIAPLSTAFARAEDFSARLSMPDVDLDALSAAPIAELLAAQDGLAAELGGAASMPFQPVVDGELFDAHPDVAYAEGATRDIDLLVGTNRDEFRLFTFTERSLSDMSDERLRELVHGYLGPAGIEVSAESFVEAYRAARSAGGEGTGPREIFESAGSDLVFRIPMLRLLSAHVRGGGRGYCYRFDWASPFAQGVLGACHALELPFVFGTLDNPVIAMFAGSGEAAAKLSNDMQAAWVAFASAGSPAVEGAPEWPEYDLESRATRVFGSERDVLDAPGEEERRFLDQVLPEFGTSADRSDFRSTATEGT